ncbi:BZ3500_MvSof-1268-A1-R1_Chr9g10406 [Microbotryum saponariae]|uniref:rRNA methyltransferase 2, mitochondrial n=1 Tax=Microbotryum saponariae TaxID=289078 RepID=A0A2X0KFC5_9BASI|nr:BZ3501_MvSof-1269-A2-R1_Chr9g10156 [Microbotryum saponariae]SDA00039.1 BZ3500_MvSof-1268-A1-R1_Chr9g10406 [Microbotryum saponariae]
MPSSRILFPARITPRQRLLNPSHPCPCSWRLSLPSSALPTQHRSTSSKSSSSSQWLSRQRRDPFVRSRTNTLLDPSASSSQSYVARSAFKLLELHQSSIGGRRRPLVRKGMTIVDLGASPGGWIQACRTLVGSSRSSGRATRGAQAPPSRATPRAGASTRIIGLDLLPLDRSLDSDPDLEFLQGDFLDPYIQAQLSELLGQDHVDLVLSDMLNNQSGSTLRDSQRSIDLCRSAWEFARKHLSVDKVRPTEKAGDAAKSWPSIQLVIKCLQSDLAIELGNELRGDFQKVRWEKPKSSRADSREGYWVCSGFKGRGGAGAGKESKEGKGKTGAGTVDEGVEESSDGLYF